MQLSAPRRGSSGAASGGSGGGGRAGAPLVADPAVHTTPPRIDEEDVLEAKVLAQARVQDLSQGHVCECDREAT